MCENLLKGHVDSLDQQQYMKVDLDEVVEEFEGFLMADYAMVDRMNVKLIEKAVKEIFGVQHAQACAQRLAAAFSHLRKKEASMTTGANCILLRSASSWPSRNNNPCQEHLRARCLLMDLRFLAKELAHLLRI